jgi:hypothetical protein
MHHERCAPGADLHLGGEPAAAAASSLDPNNLQYQDVLLGLATGLLEQLPDGVTIDDVRLSKLRSWFDERLLTHEATREFASEVQAGAEALAGIPWLTKVFARLTTAFRFNSTYKNELRTVVRNHFSEFADAFNQLIVAVEQACQRQGCAQRVLFLVDGTDRLRGEDAENFFVRDVHQLQLVKALFVYTAPIHLTHAGAALNQTFTSAFKLPMVKLYERDGAPNPAGFAAMRALLFNRAAPELFDSPDAADVLVEQSGGHPRDLLRLLQYTFQHTRGEQFDRGAAVRAADSLATDYRLFLEADDYVLLGEIDRAPTGEHNSERVRFLLYNLALLEYNSFWWRSHPFVRRLDAYQECAVPADP